MTIHDSHIACDEFAVKLADHLEGDLPEAARAAMQAHASRCAECGRMLSELDAVRTEAAVLPPLAPSRDLWAGIAERIDARVLPLEGMRVERGIMLRRTWRHPALAAAALVLFTAGVTHVLTRASMESPATESRRTLASVPAPDSEPAAASPATAPAMLATGTTEPEGRAAGTSDGTRGARSTGTRALVRERGDRPGEVRTGPLVRQVVGPANAGRIMRTEVEPVYDREIVKLRAIVRDRRAQLDPQTVAVLEQSIAVIDSAIAQSRAALAKDPASGFLATQLNHSLEKKVELLRTAALLPART